jgi:hypothetical protein
MRKATLVVELLNSFFKVYGKLTRGEKHLVAKAFLKEYPQTPKSIDRVRHTLPHYALQAATPETAEQAACSSLTTHLDTPYHTPLFF